MGVISLPSDLDPFLYFGIFQVLLLFLIGFLVVVVVFFSFCFSMGLPGAWLLVLFVATVVADGPGWGMTGSDARRSYSVASSRTAPFSGTSSGQN
jgi:hypothetical protein